MPSRKMDLFNIWLPIIGGILLGAIAVGAWYAGDKLIAIWCGFFGVVCFLLLAALQFHENVILERQGAIKISTAPEPDKAPVQTNFEAERAFVFLNSFEVHLLGNIVRVMPKWENSGPTRTKDMRSRVSWKFFPGAPPSDFPYPDLDGMGQPDTSPEERPAFVGPKSMTFAFPLDIPIVLIEHVRDKQGQILVWGWTEYNDVFDGTLRHRTEFCNELAVLGFKIANADQAAISAAISFPMCGPHNSAN